MRQAVHSYAGKMNGAFEYQRQEALTGSPEQILLMIYDHGIKSCRRKDESGATDAIVKLIDGLNFKYADIANGLFRLYDYMLRLVKAGKFDETLKFFTELRDAWQTGFANNGLIAA